MSGAAKRDRTQALTGDDRTGVAPGCRGPGAQAKRTEHHEQPPLAWAQLHAAELHHQRVEAERLAVVAGRPDQEWAVAPCLTASCASVPVSIVVIVAPTA
jgi:hypothetical protein